MTSVDRHSSKVWILPCFCLSPALLYPYLAHLPLRFWSYLRCLATVQEENISGADKSEKLSELLLPY
eukprot:scaffold529_cov196-Alexandrium_tamarense.AAC.67